MGTLTDPSSWHLETAGGIKYALMDGFPKSRVGRDSVTFTEEILIQAPNLLAFLVESFPAPIIYANFFLRGRPRSMPGYPPAITTGISSEPFPPGKPADPFWADSRNDRNNPTVIHESYTEFLKLSIEYAITQGGDDNNGQDPDPNDETTFLTIAATAAGEFLKTKSKGNMKWITSGDPPIKTPVTSPDIDVLVTVPETEWTVTWKHVPDDYFRNKLKPRLDDKLGTVNISAAPKILFNAPAETILLAAYGLNQEFSNADSIAQVLAGEKIGPPAISLDIKFVEKRISYKDNVTGNWEIGGHNHLWKDGDGWMRITRDGTNPLYDKTDMSKIFVPT